MNKIFSFWVFTNYKLSAIIPTVLRNMASWCSRLARQPVTLEVDGSSPFEVAKKEVIPFGMTSFFVIRKGLEHSKWNRPVDDSVSPAGRGHIHSVPSPFEVFIHSIPSPFEVA